MHNAYIGTWSQESHVPAALLHSMRDLNHHFLDLAWSRAPDAGGLAQGGAAPRTPAALAGRFSPLSSPQRAAAADCPYALFDLRFEDEAHWSARLGQEAEECRWRAHPAPESAAREWRVADEPAADEDTINFVRLALFYAWHVASSAGLAARLLFGMHGGTVDAFRRITVNSLPGLAAAEAAHLSARWSGCGAYRNALIGAAARADAPALRRIQLYGLQLAVAARLPSA